MKIRSFNIVLALLLLVSSVYAIHAAGESGVFEKKEEIFRQIQLFSDSFTLISTDYVEKVDIKELVYGAIRGMMDTLDGYSQFLDPESFREITEETKGEFAGIGITIGIREGILTVISPIEDTPASRAGVEAGDKVVRIDGESTRDMTLDGAVEKLRGEEGTVVNIEVLRDGEDDTRSFDITRAVIKLKSIKEARLIEGNIGYVRIVEFQQRTADDLRAGISSLVKEGATSLIIDMRNNPGGLFDAAIDVADEFLPKGTLVVYTEGRDPENRKEFRAMKNSDLNDIPLVLLVNKGSASAAEIVAGAIKDNRRGVVVGVPTFGKGSVQTVIPLSDQSALRLTTAAYFTPSGKNLRDKGVDPDIYVENVRLGTGTEENGKDRESLEKDRVFSKLQQEDGSDKTNMPVEKEGTSGSIRGIEPGDMQLRTAVNILEASRLFREYEETPEKAARTDG